MKCELCNIHNAETAITLVRGGKECELYVCKECARKEQIKRQKKSHRTRMVTGLPPGMEMSITQIGGSDEEAPPPIIGAIMDAISSMVTTSGKSSAADKPETSDEAYTLLPTERTAPEFRVKDALHLEGLFLIGELDAVKLAMKGLKLRLTGFELDGVVDAGHVFRFEYTGLTDRAKRVAEDLLTQERHARERLLTEFPRVFGDSLCRSLAILKNCRLLSQGELFDLLSPIRLAALNGLLDGITLEEVESLIESIDIDELEASLPSLEQDDLDARRADEINRKFEDVVLSELAGEKFL